MKIIKYTSRYCALSERDSRVQQMPPRGPQVLAPVARAPPDIMQVARFTQEPPGYLSPVCRLLPPSHK